MKTLFDLFVAFFRASILSYGGGPESIPLMQKEVVNNYKWLSNDKFSDVLAMGNSLPGPIAPKIAAYMGYNVAGILGAFVAVCAVAVPTTL